MSDIFQISVSGLRSFQIQLATTSNNITNVNTEGYSRQRVDLSTNAPAFSGVGYLGTGVSVASIQREFDSFIDTQVVTNTGLLNQLDELYSLASQLDNLVADPNAGISPGIQNFFDAIQSVSDDPSSLPARQSLISESQALIDRFSNFDRRFDGLLEDANATTRNSVSEINSLSSNIADLNLRIITAQGNSTTQPINDLLDQRQQLIVELSKNVSVNTLEQSDGSLNVFIGSGQALVVGTTAQQLSTGNNPYNVARLDVFASNGTSQVNISEQITGGKLGAAITFVRDTLNPTVNALGRVALGLADTVNSQSRLGQDLNGALGNDFFSAINSNNFGVTVAGGSQNSPAAAGLVSATITDTANLSTSNYVLRYSGGNQYTLIRSSDNFLTSIDASAGYPYTSAAIDGFTFTITGAPAVADSYEIRPTENAVGGLSLSISDPRAIAAAVPVRADSALANTGAGIVGAPNITSAGAYVADTYRVIAGDNSSAVADGGVTRGTITDNNADSTLQYELRVNGTLLYTQNEAAAPLANVTALAAQINGSVATTGVRAYVNAAGTDLYLVNEPQSALAISVTETLATTAGTVEDLDTVTGYFGSVLTGVTTPSATVTFSGAADSYVVLDSSNTAVADGAYTSGNAITFNGVQTSISGVANLGDTFTVSPNTSGVSDNRNLLIMGALQNVKTLAGGTATYNEAYGFSVAEVGSQTRKIEITRDAQDVLLNQSIEARASKSGVNLDEEAANLIKFQQAYQAVAQMISISDELFRTLIAAVGR